MQSTCEGQAAKVTCHANSARFRVLSAMWALRAESLPFCMEGTREEAAAHSTTIAAPAYRCGPGNSLPVRSGAKAL